MKIIKKHDKSFPAAPLRSFFTQHLANHPWGTDGQPSLWALVSAIFQQLHTAPFSNTTAAAAADVSSSAASGPLPVLGGAHASHASTTSVDQSSSAVSGRAPRLSGTVGATSPGLVDADAEAVSYKYWVKQEDVSQVSTGDAPNVLPCAPVGTSQTVSATKCTCPNCQNMPQPDGLELQVPSCTRDAAQGLPDALCGLLRR